MKLIPQKGVVVSQAQALNLAGSLLAFGYTVKVGKLRPHKSGSYVPYVEIADLDEKKAAPGEATPESGKEP